MIKLKLKEITEPREGFVYNLAKQNDECKFKDYILCEDSIYYGENLETQSKGTCKYYIKKGNLKLIGALGITHRIEDGKLVEIPQRDIEVGDVLECNHVKIFVSENEFDGTKWTVILDDGSSENDNTQPGYDLNRFIKKCDKDYRKLGILNVHYELVLKGE